MDAVERVLLQAQEGHYMQDLDHQTTRDIFHLHINSQNWAPLCDVHGLSLPECFPYCDATVVPIVRPDIRVQ